MNTKINQLTGAHFCDARTFLNISLSSVSKMTGVGRNPLSAFEKEKGSLTSTQKKTLVSFYEECCYEFVQLESVNDDVFDERVSDSRQLLEQAVPKEVSQCMIDFMDTVLDKIDSLDKPGVVLEESELQFHALIEESDETLSLLYQKSETEKLIVEHL